MRITFSNFKGFHDILSKVIIVSEDSYNDQSLRTIGIMVSGNDTSNTVSVFGINSSIAFSYEVPASDYVCSGIVPTEEGFSIYQLDSKSFMNFLNVCKNSRKTEIKEITMEDTEKAVNCTILEVDKEVKKSGGNSDDTLMSEMLGESTVQQKSTGRTYISNRVFVKVPFKSSYLTFINELKTAGDSSEFVELNTIAMKMIVEPLLAVLSTDTSSYSFISFDEAYAVCAYASGLCCVVNPLSEQGVFSDVKLSYKVINFISKVVVSSENCYVAKTEKRIIIKTDEFIASCGYDTKLINYKLMTSSLSKDNAVSVDRLFFKDTLKRLELFSESSTFVIDTEAKLLRASNKEFNAEIPITNIKGMSGFNGTKFTVLPVMVDKAILGSDNQFVRDIGDGNGNEDVYIYINYDANNPKTSSISMSDYSGIWTSVMRTSLVLPPQIP